LSFSDNYGHEISIDDEFCQNCGTPKKRVLEEKSTATATGIRLGGLGRLRSLRAILLLAIIVGASMLGASFAFQPRSTSPEYLASLRDQLSQLSGKLSGLQQQADNLRSQVNALQAEISASQSKVSNLQGEIQQLQNQLTSVRSEIVILRQQLDDVGRQLTSARSSLKVAQQELSQLRSQLQEATTKVQQLESALQQQKATMQNYVANRDQAQSRHDSLLAQYNARAATYNTRATTYDQKKQEYDSRWASLNGKIGDCVLRFLICGVVCAFVSQACLICLEACPGIGAMIAEYNALEQLKSWLSSELAWLQSEHQQLRALKAQLDQAARDVAHWNDLIQNQQATISRTQSDLDSWTAKKNQLASQVNDAQNRVDQLATQVTNLESQQNQLQSRLDLALAKEQELESSAKSKEAEVNGLLDLIQSRSKDKATAEATLRTCEADMQRTRNEIKVVSDEINLVVVHPYLRYGGLALFAAAIATLFVATVGTARLVTGLRAGVGTLRGLPRKLRAKPAPEVAAPAEVVEEAPVELPAKPELEVRVIPVEPTAPVIEKPRKMRPPAAKPRRRKPLEKRKKAGKRREPIA
jgi:predicted  nucleic acid-binding Zn-ribbon protein